MARKEYRCHRWPELRIRDHIKFTDGIYHTEDEADQKLLESLDYFGSLLWEEKDPPVDVVPHVEPKTSVDATSTTQERGKWRVK